MGRPAPPRRLRDALGGLRHLQSRGQGLTLPSQARLTRYSMTEEKTYVVSKCPKCNNSRTVPFLRVELLDLLGTGRPINCMCAPCNQVWPITQAERAALHSS
jgi:hypothetical protein